MEKIDKGKKIARSITYISKLLILNLNNELIEYGLTGKQGRILGFIAKQDGIRDVYQKTIEEEFNIRRSSTSTILYNLEKNGLIVRVDDMNDGRLKKLLLTEKGKRADLSARKQIQFLDEKICEGFSDEDLDDIISKLEYIIKNVEDKNDKEIGCICKRI